MASTNDEPAICEPGSFLSFDYLPESKDAAEGRASYGDDRLPMLKAVQWNIERGYQIDRIVEILRRHQGDIICLQELDIGCDRTDGRNVPELIAEALQMNCVFVNEFVEFRSKKRRKHVQGGGVHGNAILSRFKMEPFVVPHSHHPVNWEKDGRLIGEPRRGERVGFGAIIFVPGLDRPIRAYSLHLEVFCGIFGRLKQFADVMEDSKRNLADYPRQLIFGDLNTMAHGIARFSPLYCSDKLRLLSIGYSEAQWWQRYIFDYATSNLNERSPILLKHAPRNLSKLDVEALTNPHFYDPFCMTKDTTLHNYLGMFKGKLDWTLIRGFHCLAKGMDNHDFKASDHKLLYVVIRPCIGSDAKELAGDIVNAYRDGRVLINYTRSFFQSILNTMLLCAVISLLMALTVKTL